MKYLCMVFYDENIINNMTSNEWKSLNSECAACAEGLSSSGKMLGGNALHPSTTATGLRIRDGKPLITDGPFAETKEQLAGFYLLDARDLNEALQLASKIPPARFGTIEIRPIGELDPTKDERFQQHFA
ncbi:MAG TPA: YciI family protein [Cellvibrio sp.]